MREEDGLAMSSRNVYLNSEERVAGEQVVWCWVFVDGDDDDVVVVVVVGCQVWCCTEH